MQAVVQWVSAVHGFLPDWFWVLLLAHAVTTCPTPQNTWARWALGIIKWGVGQRISAVNAVNGLQSEVTAVTSAQKTALANGSTMEVVKTPEGVLKPVTSETGVKENGTIRP